MKNMTAGWILALAAFVSATVLAAPARTAELDGAKWIWHPQGARDNQKVTFRAAFDAYRQAFPDNFAVRAVKQGNWMAFADISKVPNDKEFGFQFKEGITELGEDDARGVTSFR